MGMCSPWLELPASWRDHAEGPAGSLEGTSWFRVVSHHMKFILYEYISLPDSPSPRGTSAFPSSCILLLLAK